MSLVSFAVPSTPEIYTLSLHDALPISGVAVGTSGLVYAHTRHATSRAGDPAPHDHVLVGSGITRPRCRIDRKSTRLNSSHLVISYAVFCLQKKKKKKGEDEQHDWTKSW